MMRIGQTGKFAIFGVLLFSTLLVFFPNISDAHTMRSEVQKDQIRIEEETFSRTENQFSYDIIKIEGKIRNLTDKKLQITYLVAPNTIMPAPKIISSDHPYTTVEDGFFEPNFSWSSDSSFEIAPNEVVTYTIEFESPETKTHFHTIVRTQDDRWRYSEGYLVEPSSWQTTETYFSLLSLVTLLFVGPNVAIAAIVLGVYYTKLKIKPPKQEHGVKRRSGLWYLLPSFLSIIGGIIAYFGIRHDDPKKARNCLLLGIVLTIGHIIAIPVYFFITGF